MGEHIITFIAGYWEWDVFVDEEFAYAFGDLGEELAEVKTKAELKNKAEELIDLMFMEFEEKRIEKENINESILKILKSNKQELKKTIVKRLAYEYAII